ncbi:glycosyl hydrolase 115 family protein [Paenibacillus daejeonensis]|uniref:glycosyl hydrolase 115 family protein n=1 Tax=Paenibacillus daejeonensis TaxID=135193 RepID=UPI00035F911C|nr:glycosyl hydrolase 115 family protein [Paenibacillus daejeonensis]
MIRHTRRMVAVLLMVALVAGMLPTYAASETLADDASWVAETENGGDFPLAANGSAATIWVDAAEEAPVQRVVADLQADIQRVTQLDSLMSSETELPSGPVIIVGTLGDSNAIQSLIAEGRITPDEVSAIQDEWEAYLIKTIDANTLVIVGSDVRGAVFGVYELSERMGVSPWYYFADAAIQTKSEVYIAADTSVIDMPDVQYRGVFLNDEEKLSRWAKEVLGDPETMGPQTYAHILELILRLKGNYLWAAMHVNSINNVPGNIDLVQQYGIVLGSSHPDMLLRTNTHEWDSWKRAYAAQQGVPHDTIQYDFTVSKAAVLQYWRENIERHKDTEAQWTLGMRGIHDEPFNVKNIMEPAYQYLGDDLETRKAGLMNEIIREQQRLLLEVLGQHNYDQSFQALIPYKEVLPIYNHPTFDLPDNVTVIWCDDNHGIMRTMPDAGERARQGGHGLYYHVSYWAPVDQSYMWLNSIPLALIGEQLSKSWEHNIRKSWILNIGDIKPQEAEMTFFLRYGWNVERYKNQPEQFLKDWMGEHFGDQHSDEAAAILTAFYQHTNVRKLEHMKVGLFNQTHFGDESSRRLAVYQDLFERAAAIYDALPEGQRLSFYQMLQAKINWAYYVNQAFYYADRSNLAFDQGRMTSADTFLRLSQEADLAKKAEIERYSTMADGKWKGFIDPEHAPPPVINQLPAGTPALVLKEPAMGVIVEGEKLPQESSRLVFSPYYPSDKFILIYNKGAGSFNWTAVANQPWVRLTADSGTVSDEIRIRVGIEQIEAHQGETAAIVITDADTGMNKTIQITVENPELVLSEIVGYVEADGYVSIEAEHYSRLNSNGDRTWQTIRNLGRAFGGDVMRAYAPDLGAVDETAIVAASPSLEYDIHLTSSGSFPLEIYRIPTLNSKGKVRFAISVDNEAPIVVESEAADEGQGTVWVNNLFHMIEKHVVDLPALSSGKHTIKLWMVDNFIMIDKLVLYTGPDGVIPSELGPDESYHPQFNAVVHPGIDLLPWVSVPAEPKNIPAGWGAGAFVEAGGQVSLEAEYAMEHVLESESQITGDMKAYTVSKQDKAPEVPGKLPNVWRLTQSDTGMAMRLPDLGGQWSELHEFPVYSPELTYKIQFGTTGTYQVWVRWRYVDNASDSIRGGLNGSNGDFSTDVFFSNSLDEKWHWKNVGKVSVDSADEHAFSLWMREDGLSIDRIYLTQGAETPTDASWIPSLRTESSTGQRLQAAVDAKRALLKEISYPVAAGPGNYSPAAYEAWMDALEQAEALAQSNTVTQEQANEALLAMTAAEDALLESLRLTEDGVFYHAYRDFSGDEIGKFPHGFSIEGMTNGATATVQEEDGNRFLRLTTTATSGKADLFLPYVGEVQATGEERIVIEYRARFNGSFQYANGAMVRNDSGTGNYSMVNAFENVNGVHEMKVHKGTSNADRVSVKKFNYNQWHTFKLVANWDARTYTVYMDDDPVPVATDFRFRHTGGTKLTGQRFGLDNMAGGSIDYDDFKVTITGIAKIAPEGLAAGNETAEAAGDGSIAGVNGAMEWSADEGASWTPVGTDATVLTDLAPGTYWIRYRATDTHQASPHVTLTILPYEPSTEPEPEPVTGVRLNQTSATLYTNHGSATLQLTAQVEPADATNLDVTWSSSNPEVASVDDNGLVRVRSVGTAIITATTADGSYTASCTVTVAVYNTGGGWQGPVGPVPPAEPDPAPDTAEPEEPVQNSDGSTTTRTTDLTSGRITETTVWPNGDRKLAIREKDGTLSEHFTGHDGSKSELLTRPDGSSRALITESNGVQVEILTSTRGEVTANVQLPVGTTQAWIKLPVKDASSFTVAYSVDADGSRTILGTSMLTEDGLSFLARGDLSVQLMENPIAFSDVSSSHWAAGAIAFTASRELFRGTEPGRFDPGASMSRAMLFTVLSRLDGTETEGGELWYSKAQDWAIAAGISDGSAPSADISREQLVTLLHRYAGAPAADGDSTSFADSGEIAAWAVHAMNWAVATGILHGKPGNLLDPGASVTRAEVATILVRFIANRSSNY